MLKHLSVFPKAGWPDSATVVAGVSSASAGNLAATRRPTTTAISYGLGLSDNWLYLDFIRQPHVRHGSTRTA